MAQASILVGRRALSKKKRETEKNEKKSEQRRAKTRQGEGRRQRAREKGRQEGEKKREARQGRGARTGGGRKKKRKRNAEPGGSTGGNGPKERRRRATGKKEREQAHTRLFQLHARQTGRPKHQCRGWPGGPPLRLSQRARPAPIVRLPRRGSQPKIGAAVLPQGLSISGFCRARPQSGCAVCRTRAVARAECRPRAHGVGTGWRMPSHHGPNVGASHRPTFRTLEAYK